MNDTSPQIELRYRNLLLQRSGEERLKMGCSMYAAARAWCSRRFWRKIQTPQRRRSGANSSSGSMGRNSPIACARSSFERWSMRSRREAVTSDVRGWCQQTVMTFHEALSILGRSAFSYCIYKVMEFLGGVGVKPIVER